MKNIISPEWPQSKKPTDMNIVEAIRNCDDGYTILTLSGVDENNRSYRRDHAIETKMLRSARLEVGDHVDGKHVQTNIYGDINYIRLDDRVYPEIESMKAWKPKPADFAVAHEKRKQIRQAASPKL